MIREPHLWISTIVIYLENYIYDSLCQINNGKFFILLTRDKRSTLLKRDHSRNAMSKTLFYSIPKINKSMPRLMGRYHYLNKWFEIL